MIQSDQGSGGEAKPIMELTVCEEGGRMSLHLSTDMHGYTNRDVERVVTAAISGLLQTAEAAARGSGHGSPIPRILGAAGHKAKRSEGTTKAHIEELNDDRDERDERDERR